MKRKRLKRVVSVSLGSSSRDHSVEVDFSGEAFEISRMGVDGDIEKAVEMLKALDGNVDAIGLGGIDIYVFSGTRRYEIKDGVRLRNCVKITPIVDGSGLKDSLERETVRYLVEETDLAIPGKTVLMVSAVDRFGMAQSLSQAGCAMIFGDLIFALGFDKPIRDLETLQKIADELLPKYTQRPFNLVYPTGKEQDREPIEKFSNYYHEADIVAGDFLFIRKYMPADLKGKIVLTNTVTPKDKNDLRQRGVEILITTTPEFEGRSFGTNVMEAVMIAYLNKTSDEMERKDYLDLLKKLGWKPRIERLN